MKGNVKLKKVFLAGFLLSLQISFTLYISSSFLSAFVGEKLTGIVFILASMTSILALLGTPRALKWLGGYKLLLSLTILDAISLFFLARADNAFSATVIFIIYFSLNALVAFTLDELVEILSRNSNTGAIRGIYLALASLALILGQVAAATGLGNSSFRLIFLAASAIMVVLFFVSLLGLREIPDPKYDRARIFKYLDGFFQNKNLARAYKINFLLQFFFSWMTIYIPIYLHSHLGFSWSQIGTIFSIMLTPYVLIEWPLGKYSDRVGERGMLMWGFFIASLFTFSLFFIQTAEVWVWALALLLTRIGAALVEVMSDVYFFKHIRAKNDEFIGVYRNTVPTAYILGPVVAFFVFEFVPTFNFIFLVLGTFMLYGVYLASTIRKGDI